MRRGKLKGCRGNYVTLSFAVGFGCMSLSGLLFVLGGVAVVTGSVPPSRDIFCRGSICASIQKVESTKIKVYSDTIPMPSEVQLEVQPVGIYYI